MGNDPRILFINLLPVRDELVIGERVNLNAFKLFEERLAESGIELSRLKNEELKHQITEQIQTAAVHYSDFLERVIHCAEAGIKNTVQGQFQCPREDQVAETLVTLEEHDRTCLATLRIRQFFSSVTLDEGSTEKITISGNELLQGLGITSVDCRLSKKGWVPEPTCSVYYANSPAASQ